ncbi:MAG: four helix bundle protein, partial [Planctomycetes bacterium]|nr:four helix bundle protein [Planctomycetota bacterium]
TVVVRLNPDEECAFEIFFKFFLIYRQNTWRKNLGKFFNGLFPYRNYIAKGSAAEVLTQAIIAFEIGYIKEATFEEIKKRCTEISAMLSKLISARSKTFRP